MRIGYAILAVLALASTGAAQETEIRPEYAHKWYLTIVYNNPMKLEDAEMHQALRNNPVLEKLRSQVNFNEWHSGMKLITDTAWKDFLGDERPVFLLQGVANKGGKSDVVFFAKGKQAYISPEFVEQLQASVAEYSKYCSWPIELREQRWKPWGPDQRCPVWPLRPSPNPPNDPLKQPDSPEPPAIEPLVPDLKINVPGVDIEIDKPDKPEETPAEGTPLVLIILPVLAGAAAGAWSHIKK